MNILIIGLGSIAKKHIVAINELYENVVIFALRSNSNNKNEIAGIINIYNINDIDVSHIDFIIISNPTSKHLQAIQEVFKYKKPLFIEKPLFSTINTDTENLVREIDVGGLSTYVACNLRFLDCIKELKRLLINSRINEVNVYAGSYLPDWRPNVDFRKVYSANIEMGGGVHIDLIHELDYVYWLFGKPCKTTSFFSNNSSLHISAYDYANYLWMYESFSASIILNYFRKDTKRTIEVVTEEGTYVVDLLKNSVQFNNICIFVSSQRVMHTYKDQMCFFVEHVLKRKEKFNTITEANTILKLCMKD